MVHRGDPFSHPSGSSAGSEKLFCFSFLFKSFFVLVFLFDRPSAQLAVNFTTSLNRHSSFWCRLRYRPFCPAPILRSVDSSSRMNHQQTPPRMAISPPMLMPHFQPSDALIAGVKSGASRPIPLPPVLMIAAALPPRRPPNSTAVSQKDA